jgi:leucyl-tRNA synthetase
MAVPAHDQRDLEFAHRFGLPVRAVLQPPPEWFTGRGRPPGNPAGTWPEAFVGEGAYLDLGVPGLDCAGLGKQAGIAAAIGWLESAGSGQRQRSYRLRDWLFSRQRYWGEPFPVVYDQDGLPVALPEEWLPVTLPEMADFRPQPQTDELDDPTPPLARDRMGRARACTSVGCLMLCCGRSARPRSGPLRLPGKG